MAERSFSGMTDINELAEAIHDWAHSKSFYSPMTHRCPKEGTHCKHTSGNLLSCLMLVVSELGEAAEALRHNDMANFREEVADTIIRLLDLCAAQHIDVAAEIGRKMAFNQTRPIKHGKSC